MRLRVMERSQRGGMRQVVRVKGVYASKDHKIDTGVSAIAAFLVSRRFPLDSLVILAQSVESALVWRKRHARNPVRSQRVGLRHSLLIRLDMTGIHSP